MEVTKLKSSGSGYFQDSVDQDDTTGAVRNGSDSPGMSRSHATCRAEECMHIPACTSTCHGMLRHVELQL